MRTLIWILLSTLLVSCGIAKKPNDPVNLKLSSSKLVDNQKEDVNSLTGCNPSCQPCGCGPCQDSRTASIAAQAAEQAQAAQAAQSMAGAHASQQIRAYLAQKAVQAARAAQAALCAKLVYVNHLRNQVMEAQAVVQEESCSCQRTHRNLQMTIASASQACHLLHTLICALKISQCNLASSRDTAEGIRCELQEKLAILEATRCRLNNLVRELCIAREDLASIKQATCTAQAAAKNACCCAQRSSRTKRAKKRAHALLKRHCKAMGRLKTNKYNPY